MPIEVVSGAAAVANVAAESCFLMLYGPPGSRKTSDAVAAFARPNGTNAAFFIPCEDGALKPVLARGLPVPDHPKDVVRTWPDLVEVMTYVAHNRNRYSAVIIDTISTWAANWYKQIGDSHKNVKNKFLIPEIMHGNLADLRVGARNLGIHVIMIAHEMAPVYDESGALKSLGGPLMVPRTAIERYYGQVDTVVRTTWVSQGLTRQRVYMTGGEIVPPGIVMPADAPLWKVKNREGCNHAVVDADLAAFLKARQPPYGGL